MKLIFYCCVIVVTSITGNCANLKNDTNHELEQQQRNWTTINNNFVRILPILQRQNQSLSKSNNSMKYRRRRADQPANEVMAFTINHHRNNLMEYQQKHQQTGIVLQLLQDFVLIIEELFNLICMVRDDGLVFKVISWFSPLRNVAKFLIILKNFVINRLNRFKFLNYSMKFFNLFKTIFLIIAVLFVPGLAKFLLITTIIIKNLFNYSLPIRFSIILSIRTIKFLIGDIFDLIRQFLKSSTTKRISNLPFMRRLAPIFSNFYQNMETKLSKFALKPTVVQKITDNLPQIYKFYLKLLKIPFNKFESFLKWLPLPIQPSVFTRFLSKISLTILTLPIRVFLPTLTPIIDNVQNLLLKFIDNFQKQISKAIIHGNFAKNLKIVSLDQTNEKLQILLKHMDNLIDLFKLLSIKLQTNDGKEITNVIKGVNNMLILIPRTIFDVINHLSNGVSKNSNLTPNQLLLDMEHMITTTTNKLPLMNDLNMQQVIQPLIKRLLSIKHELSTISKSVITNRIEIADFYGFIICILEDIFRKLRIDPDMIKPILRVVLFLLFILFKSLLLSPLLLLLLAPVKIALIPLVMKKFLLKLLLLPLLLFKSPLLLLKFVVKLLLLPLFLFKLPFIIIAKIIKFILFLPLIIPVLLLKTLLLPLLIILGPLKILFKLLLLPLLLFKLPLILIAKVILGPVKFLLKLLLLPLLLFKSPLLLLIVKIILGPIKFLLKLLLLPLLFIARIIKFILFLPLRIIGWLLNLLPSPINFIINIIIDILFPIVSSPDISIIIKIILLPLELILLPIRLLLLPLLILLLPIRSIVFQIKIFILTKILPLILHLPLNILKILFKIKFDLLFPLLSSSSIPWWLKLILIPIEIIFLPLKIITAPIRLLITLLFPTWSRLPVPLPIRVVLLILKFLELPLQTIYVALHVLYNALSTFISIVLLLSPPPLNQLLSFTFKVPLLLLRFVTIKLQTLIDTLTYLISKLSLIQLPLPLKALLLPMDTLLLPLQILLTPIAGLLSYPLRLPFKISKLATKFFLLMSRTFIYLFGNKLKLLFPLLTNPNLPLLIKLLLLPFELLLLPLKLLLTPVRIILKSFLSKFQNVPIRIVLFVIKLIKLPISVNYALLKRFLNFSSTTYLKSIFLPLSKPVKSSLTQLFTKSSASLKSVLLPLKLLLRSLSFISRKLSLNLPSLPIILSLIKNKSMLKMIILLPLILLFSFIIMLLPIPLILKLPLLLLLLPRIIAYLLPKMIPSRELGSKLKMD